MYLCVIKVINIEEVHFEKLTEDKKLILLKALGYDVNENGFILNDKKKYHICPYTNMRVLFKNASILPGSVVIINTSSLTLSEYITDYVDV